MIHFLLEELFSKQGYKKGYFVTVKMKASAKNILPLQSVLLTEIQTVQHGFFTRHGGLSEGIFSSLNVGLSSGDDRLKVFDNRSFIANSFNQPHSALVMCTQVHGSKAHWVNEPWGPTHHPEGDAMMTDQPNIILGVQTADCCPILLSSSDGKIIAAIHAGWKGALNGVIHSTISLMQERGAENISAAIGPAIAQENYEVGADLHNSFITQDSSNKSFFVPSQNSNHFLFDIKGYCLHQCEKKGVTVDILPHDTYADENILFSCRRSNHQQENVFGRQISCIMKKS